MEKARKEMDAVDFATQLFGVIPVKQANQIYQNISHYTETKKNIIVDLLRANPSKYIPVLLRDDE